MKHWEGSGEAVTLPYCWAIATLEKQYGNSAVSYTWSYNTTQNSIPRYNPQNTKTCPLKNSYTSVYSSKMYKQPKYRSLMNG